METIDLSEERVRDIVRHVLRAYDVRDKDGDPLAPSTEYLIGFAVKAWLDSGETPRTNARTADEILN